MELYKPFSFLSKKEKKNFIKLEISQLLISFFDVLGILLAGFTISVAVSKITGQKIPEIFIKFFDTDYLMVYSDYSKLLILLSISVLLLIAKTVFSLILTHKINNQLSDITIRMSEEAINNISSSQILWLNRKDPSKIMYALGEGINNDFKNYLLGFYYISSETIFILIISCFLFFTNPILTLTIYILLFIAFLILQKFSLNQFYKLGKEEINLINKNNSMILTMLKSFRELHVSNHFDTYKRIMSNTRRNQNSIRARTQWFEQSPKFVLEFFVIVIGLVLYIFATIPSSATSASSTLLIFGLAITRLSPSLLRAQMGITLFKNYGVRFGETDTFLSEIQINQSPSTKSSKVPVESPTITIEFKGVTFGYPDSKNILENFSKAFTVGKVNCVIGHSGAGKSTFADILLGLVPVNVGDVFINGTDVKEWRLNFPTSTYYIPQEGIIFPGSFIENISFKKELLPDELVKLKRVLSEVQLFDNDAEVFDLSQDLYSGSFLSGGEKQRLIIARALFTDARIIVLDEPTAAMDSQSEKLIFELLDSISVNRLVLLITHSEIAKQMFEKVTVIE